MLRVHLWLMGIASLILPVSFRQDYEREISLLFRDELRGGHSQLTTAARIWLALIPDLISTALRGHAELFRRDFRSWCRLVLQRKALAFGLIGNFAASIALASAMFSVTYALLLRSLPYHEPDRIVRLDNFPTVLAQSNPGAVREWLRTQEIFEDLAYYSPWEGNLEAEDHPIRVRAANVSGSFFGVFRQSVLLGADFDESRGGFAVLSDTLWQNQFGGDPTIVGKTVRVNGEELRVRGVMRPGFLFPENTQVWTHAQGEEAFMRLLEGQQAVFTYVVGRLTKGASYGQGASAAMALSLVLVGEEARNYPKHAVPLQMALTADIRRPVLFLTVAAAMLLLLGCASAAGLLVARNAQKRRDLVVRMALGARAALIRRQVTTEGLLFALSGGAFGIWGTYFLVRLIPRSVLPVGLLDVAIDKSVLGVCVLTALGSGALAGWAAGWNVARDQQTLANRARSGHSLVPSQFGKWLIGGQIGLTVALLVWAALQGKSLYGLVRTDLGFDAAHIVTATISFRGSPYETPESRRRLLGQWQRRIEAAIPGSRVAAISKLPLRGDAAALLRFEVEGASTKILARHRIVSANYIATVGGRIVAGQDFNLTGKSAAGPVALVNEQFAKALGITPSQLIGQRIEDPGESRERPARVIIGVYRRESSVAPGIDSGPEVSYPLSERAPAFLSILVHVPVNPAGMARLVQDAIRHEAPNVSVFDVRPMPDYVNESLAAHRLFSLILGLFAALSTVTSIAGLISVVLFYVSSQHHEMGIRMALGATAPRLVSLVVKHGIPLLVAGIAVGEVVAIAGGKGIAALLVDVRPLDTAVHLSVCAALFLSGSLAMLFSSLKVAKVDPSVTLRSQ